MQATTTERHIDKQPLEEGTMALTAEESGPSSHHPTSPLEKRIYSLTMNLEPYYRSIFLQLAASNGENAQILCDFITA
jgi:hypothetical protein